jgi:hypothetical protein
MRRVQSSGSTSSSHHISGSRSKSQAKETAKAVKDAAKAIRDAAISTREAVKAFSDSGVVTDLAESIQAATKAARETARGINDTSRELHKSRITPKVASTIHQTLSMAEETGAKAETSTLLSKSAPQTTGTPLIRTKRKRKSRNGTVTKKAMKRLTTDETKSQINFNEMEGKSNTSTKVRRKNRKSKK